MKTLLLVLCVSVVINAESVPFPEKCVASDAKCMKQAAIKAIPIIAAGLPQYEVKPLDPLVIKKIDASSNSLNLILKDVSVKGLGSCKAKKLQFDTDINKIVLKLLCDVTIDGNYVMSGSILVLPMEGDGPLHAELNQLVINVELDLIDNLKDNKKYLKVKSFKHSFDLKAKSKVDFQNLFNGNQVLGRAARELIANNGNDIILEIGPPAVKAIVGKVVDSVDQLLRHAASNDLFL